MIRPHQPSRLLALSAAYVIALQALLLPLSVAAGSPFLSGLCASSGSAGGSSTPVSHGSGCPCAAGCGMQCGIHLFHGPAQKPVLAYVARVLGSMPRPKEPTAVRAAVATPHCARGPPAA